MWRRLLRHLLRTLLIAFLGGLLGATMVRFSPGFGVDERELDPRLRAESVQAMRQESTLQSNIFIFYAKYLSGLLHGNLGDSRSLQRPVSQLLAERIPITLKSVGVAVLVAWTLALALALPATVRRSWGYDASTMLATGVFLSVPSALIALLFLYLRASPTLAIALVVFVRVFRYARNLLLASGSSPHVLCAMAKGISPLGVAFRHVLPLPAPELLALFGVSVNFALGAAIPVEVICDSPGIGQLAWMAAQGRDLPLLVNLLLLVTLLTLVANGVSDLIGRSLAREAVTQ